MSDPEQAQSRKLMGYCAVRYHDGATRAVVQQELEQHFHLTREAATIASALGEDKRNWPLGCTASLEADANNPNSSGLRVLGRRPARRLWLRIPLLCLGLFMLLGGWGHYLLGDLTSMTVTLVIGVLLCAGFFILKPRARHSLLAPSRL